MKKTLNIALPAALLVSALALSACASKSEPPAVAAPAPVEAVAEKPPVAEVAAEPTPAPAVVAEPQPVAKAAPKKKAHKAKKVVVKQAEPVAPPPPPAPAPAPVVEAKAPPVVQPEPTPPAPVALPVKEVAEPGFLEQYWVWLLGVLIVIAGVIAWRWGSQRDQH